MKTVSLSGSPRENVGKKDASSLRRTGQVPAVLYGGEQQYHFHLNHTAIEKIIHSPDTYKVELDLDGASFNCIIKDIQFHPVTDKIVHVDFLQMFDDKPISVNLPVIPQGIAVGVVNGGMMMVNFRKLTVRGLPNAIPAAIDVDVSNIEIGQGVRIGDVKVPDCELLQNPMDVVISVKTTRVAKSVEDTAELVEGEEGDAEGESEGEGE